MASLEQEGFFQEDDRFCCGEVEIFNLSSSEAGDAFEVKAMAEICKNFPTIGDCKSINGLLIFTLREFPGLVVDILSTNNNIVQLTRQIMHYFDGPRRKPARA